MAIELVQSRVGNATTLAFLSNVTAGNLIVVSQASFGVGHTISTPTDTLLHTYLPITAEQSVANIRLRSFHVADIDGGANTVTFGGGSERAVVISEWSGVKTVSPLDDTSVGSGVGTAASSGDVTATADNSLLFAATTINANNVQITEEWTLLQELIPAAAVGINTQWKLQAGAATEDADATIATSQQWLMHAAVFLDPFGIVASVPGGASVRTNRGFLGRGRRRGFLYRDW